MSSPSSLKTTGVRTRVHEILEDSVALGLSGFPLMPLLGYNPSLMTYLLMLASVGKALPSLAYAFSSTEIEKGYRRRIYIEDGLLVLFATIGFALSLYLQDQDVAVLGVALGIMSKAVPSLTHYIKNKSKAGARKELVEDGLSLSLAMFGVIYYLIHGDPSPNPPLFTTAFGILAKTNTSLITIRNPISRFGSPAYTAAALGGAVLIASLCAQLTLTASTDRFSDQPALFHAPLTVGFNLGNANYCASKVMIWHFGDKDVKTSDVVIDHTYESPPKNGTYYDVWVEVGHYKGAKFVSETNSSHSHVVVNPASNNLVFLNNNPNQWHGYAVAGNAIGFLVSEHKNSPVSWQWNDPRSATDELNTDDLNPSHIYRTSGSYLVHLTAGQDQWNFPVLVIPNSQPLEVDLEVMGPHGLLLFQAGDKLYFSLVTNENLDGLRLQPDFGDKPPKYSWHCSCDNKTFLRDSPDYTYQFTAGGNYQVRAIVTNYDGTTQWITVTKTISVLDRPSINVTISNDTTLGTPYAIVRGIGFPPDSAVEITIDQSQLSGQLDSRGHFVTSGFSLAVTPPGTHRVFAQSVNYPTVNATTSFTTN